MSSFYAVLTHKCNDIQDATLINDIESHLSNLLNARQYMLSTTMDYGLPDVCAEYTGAYSQKVLEAIRDLINRFEPRLTIKQMTCENPNQAHNQLKVKVVASVPDLSIIELYAKLGSQRLNSVKVA